MKPKVKVYNLEGKETEEIELPAEIFDIEMNPDLVHQVVVAQMSAKRPILACTKTRAEVRGGGKKPWRQKGTGRARHGSIRSPIWIGGGVTFGPTKEKVFKKKINKKMKRKALFMVLSQKLRDNDLVVLEALQLPKAKTKEMVKLLEGVMISLQKAKDSILLVLTGKEADIIRATKNIPFAKTLRADSLNVVDLLSYKYLFLPKEAVEIIKKTYV